MNNRKLQKKRNAPKLPFTFTGDGLEDISAWLEHIEVYFAAQQINISENQQVICLALNLSGKIVKWFYNMRGNLPLEQF